MRRVFRFLTVLCIINAAFPARAQVRLGPKGPEEVTAEGHVKPRPRDLQLHQLRVTPAAQPSPALKYTFWTKFPDQRDGNAVPYIYRALLMKPKDPGDQPLHESYERWMEATPGAADFPADEMHQFVQRASASIEALETAAMRDQVDWGWSLRELRGTSTVAFLLPEIQEARDLGRMLCVKARLEIHRRQYEQAINTLGVAYFLAHAVGSERTLVNSLVGTAIANIANRQVIALIGSPGSPNVYWALAQIPRPLIDYRGAYEYEAMVAEATFPFLKDAGTADHSPAQWKALLLKTVGDLRFIGASLPAMPTDELTLAALVAQGYPTACQVLAREGFDAARIDEMPMGQAIAIAEARVLRKLADDLFKWSLLPFPESAHFAKRFMTEVDNELRRDETLPIGQTLFPTVYAARTAEVRSESELNALMLIEALRMHASQHRQLPADLPAIDQAPTFRNPATGEAFSYRIAKDVSVGQDTAIIEIPDPMGIRQRDLRFEIQLNTAP